MHRWALTMAVWLAVLSGRSTQLPASDLELAGLTVTPHVQAPNLRWRVPPDPHLGVRAELFLRNASDSAVLVSAVDGIRFDGQTPSTLTAKQQWTWHDTPERWNEPALQLPAGTITVLRFNTRTRSWGVGTDHAFALNADDTRQITLEQPDVWISAVTFPGTDLATRPTSMIVHVTNQQKNALRVTGCRLWLPAGPGSLHVFQESDAVEQLTLFPDDGRIPPGEKGCFVAQCVPLPLTYGVVEVNVTLAFAQPRSLFAHLRIKPEVFDISSGELGRFLFGRRGVPNEPYLKTLTCMHINTAHTRSLPRSFDDDGVLDSHPLKLFSGLSPIEQFDRDQILARVHAVDLVGKLQFGGRRRMSPQEVLADPMGSAAGDDRGPDAQLARAEPAEADRLLVASGVRGRSGVGRPIAGRAYTGRTACTGLPRAGQPHHVALLVQCGPPFTLEIPRRDRADHTHQPRDPPDRRSPGPW